MEKCWKISGRDPKKKLKIGNEKFIINFFKILSISQQFLVLSFFFFVSFFFLSFCKVSR